MAPSRDSLATPLSHDVRQTGGFASPPLGGFAHFNAFASLQLPRIAPTMYSHFKQPYRCSLSRDPLLSQMQAAGVEVLTAEWPNRNPAPSTPPTGTGGFAPLSSDRFALRREVNRTTTDLTRVVG
jgi:hypothetical protein